MIPLPPARARSAAFSLHLAAFALLALIPASPAWAGPTFDLAVDIEEAGWIPPTPDGGGSIGVRIHLNLGDSWYLDAISIRMPKNARGESYRFDLRYIDEYFGFESLRDVPGSMASLLGFAVGYGDPAGRFTGGLVTVTAMRFEDGVPWSDDATRVYETRSAEFSFEIPASPRDPNAVPEPSGAIPAAIAAAGGAALAASRRRRAG